MFLGISVYLGINAMQLPIEKRKKRFNVWDFEKSMFWNKRYGLV